MANILPLLKKRLDKFTQRSISNMGNFLILTNACAWLASSLSQIYGIAKNKEYTNKQKKYMIAQEGWDAATNIGLYVIFTMPLVAIAKKLVSTGKIAPKEVYNYMNKNKLLGKRGSWDLNLSALSLDEKTKQAYNAVQGFFGTGASLLGGIISSNIFTPCFRNKNAAKNQNKNIEQTKLDNINQVRKPNTPNPVINTKRHSFDDFRHGITNMPI